MKSVSRLATLIFVLTLSLSVSIYADLEQLTLECGPITNSVDCRDCCFRAESTCVGACASTDYSCYSDCFKENRTCLGDCGEFFPSM